MQSYSKVKIMYTCFMLCIDTLHVTFRTNNFTLCYMLYLELRILLHSYIIRDINFCQQSVKDINMGWIIKEIATEKLDKDTKVKKRLEK